MPHQPLAKRKLAMAPDKRVEQYLKSLREIFPETYPSPNAALLRKILSSPQDKIQSQYRHETGIKGFLKWAEYGYRPISEIITEYENLDWIMCTVDADREPIYGLANARWTMEKDRLADEFYNKEGFMMVEGFDSGTMHWQECVMRWVCKYFSVYPTRAFIRMNTQAGFRLYGHMLDVCAANALYKQILSIYYTYKDAKIPPLTNRNSYRLSWIRNYLDAHYEPLWINTKPENWVEIDRIKKEGVNKYFDLNFESFLVHFGRLTKDQEKYIEANKSGS